MNKSRKLKRIYTLGLTTTLAVGLSVGTVMVSSPSGKTVHINAEEAIASAAPSEIVDMSQNTVPTGNLFKV